MKLHKYAYHMRCIPDEIVINDIIYAASVVAMTATARVNTFTARWWKLPE